MKLYISPSTQQDNKGPHGYVEETQMNLIADILIPELIKEGFEIKRNQRTFPGVNIIVEESNAWGADYHIAIHSNAWRGITRGCQVYCDNPTDLTDKATQLAHSIYDEITAVALVPGRGVLSGHDTMSEIKYVKAHSVLMEIDYHDTVGGADWIMANIKNIAFAILKGILRHLEVEMELKKDAKGQAVYNYQMICKRLGGALGAFDDMVDNTPTGCDGKYGNGMVVVTNAFQKKYVLPVTADGLVTDVLMNRMNKELQKLITGIPQATYDAVVVKNVQLATDLKVANGNLVIVSADRDKKAAEAAAFNTKNIDLSNKLTASEIRVVAVIADRDNKLNDLLTIAKAQDIISKY